MKFSKKFFFLFLVLNLFNLNLFGQDNRTIKLSQFNLPNENLDIDDIDIFTQEDFKTLIQNKQNQNKPYILARVVTQGATGTNYVHYYDAESLNNYMLGGHNLNDQNINNLNFLYHIYTNNLYNSYPTTSNHMKDPLTHLYFNFNNPAKFGYFKINDLAAGNEFTYSFSFNDIINKVPNVMTLLDVQAAPPAPVPAPIPLPAPAPAISAAAALQLQYVNNIQKIRQLDNRLKTLFLTRPQLRILFRNKPERFYIRPLIINLRNRLLNLPLNLKSSLGKNFIMTNPGLTTVLNILPKPQALQLLNSTDNAGRTALSYLKSSSARHNPRIKLLLQRLGIS